MLNKFQKIRILVVQARRKQVKNLQVQLRNERFKIILRNLVDEKQTNFDQGLFVFEAVGL
jgi:hypothetical protein